MVIQGEGLFLSPTQSQGLPMPSKKPLYYKSQKKESSFQYELYGLARLNGWQITLEHVLYDTTPLHQWLHFWFRGKLQKIRDFLLGRKRNDFLLVYHTHDSRLSAPGWPDLVFVHPTEGRIIFAELKRKGEYPKKEQRLWLSALSVAAEKNPLVEVYLWREEDWEDIVEVLGGLDSRKYC